MVASIYVNADNTLIDKPPRSRSPRQLRPGLLRHHLLGVSVGPVRLGRTNTLLVLSRRGRHTPDENRSTLL
jgi:hypothetical protein